MQVNDSFMKAKNSKEVRAIVIASRTDNNVKRNYMYLCLEETSKYDRNKRAQIYVETDTEFRIENYSSHAGEQIEVDTILFHCHVWHNGPDHISTFLAAIKKTSNVKFRVVAYNGSEFNKEKNTVSHQLYGIIDEKSYFLSSYDGANNSASPVQ